MKMGKLLGMNEVAAAGMVATLANSIPMFQMLKDMDERGKIINVAFAVSAAFVLGDHLGFTAGVAQDMIFPMIVGKLVGGVTAVAVGIYMANRMMKKNKAKEQTAVKIMADISKELIEQLVKQVVLEKWVKVPNMLIQVVFYR